MLFQINNVAVTKVFLKDSKAVHFISSPIDNGVEATVKVDWDRRFDHMQQHSGIM